MQLLKITRDRKDLAESLADLKIRDREEANPNSILIPKDIYVEDVLRFSEQSLDQSILTLSEQPIGYVVGKSTPCNAYEIQKYFVQPESRSHGFGSTIINEQITIARERGHSFIFAYVYPHNESSLRVFEKLGFRKQNCDGAYLVLKNLKKLN